MSCDDVQASVAPYLGERLSTVAAGAVREHLEACAACRAALDEHAALKALITRGVAAEPPAEATAALLASAHRRVTRRRWRLGLAATIAALAVMIGLVWWRMGPCLLGDCASSRALAAAHALRGAPSRTVADLGLTPGSPDAPDLEGLDRVGADLVGQGVRVVRYACADAEVLLIHAPHPHVHAWEERTLADGRSYVMSESGSAERIAWVDGRGRLWCCVGPAGDRLVAVATTLRAST